MKLTIKHTLIAASAFMALALSVPAADEKKTDADNSKKNERDQSGETKTPGDQSNAPEDIKLVRTIRQAVMKDDSLSATAKNVKIITQGGQVTLRGPVNSADEKTKIEEHARSAAGKDKVNSQLEVKADGADKK